jgi:hypothetical protein
MKNKSFTLLFAILLGTLLLGACTRSATSQDTPEVTQNPIESIFSTVATQTALAASGAKSPDDQTGNDDGSTDDGPSITSVPTQVPTSTPEPTPTNTAAPTSDPGPAPLIYTLREGEWPYCLARRFDVNPDALIEVNGLSEAAELSVGTQLTIPTNQGAFGGQRALRSHPTTYTASGIDTFYSIACEFGDLYPESIAEANSQSVDYVPSAGEVLQIP